MKIFLLVVVLSSALAPARAQSSDQAFQGQLGQVQSQVKAAASAASKPAPTPLEREAAANAAKVTAVLELMEKQGPGSVGADTVRILKGLSGKIRVVFADSPVKFKVDWDAMMTTGVAGAVFSRSVAKGSSRYLAVFLAEAAPTLVRQPKTAEDEYMVLSRMTRAWLELGGEPAKLPGFDGTADAETAARLRLWLDFKDLPSLARSVQLPSVSVQLDSNRKAQADLKALIVKWKAEGQPALRTLGLENTLSNLQSDEGVLASGLNEYQEFIKNEDDWVRRYPESKAAALGCHAARVIPQMREKLGSDCGQ